MCVYVCVCVCVFRGCSAAPQLAHVCANFSDVVRENRGAAWQALPEEMLSEVLGSEELVVADSELEVRRAVPGEGARVMRHLGG